MSPSSDPAPPPVPPDPRRALPIRIAGTYAAVGLLGIWITNLALLLTGEQTRNGFGVAIGKGTLFIGSSAVLIYGLVRAHVRALARRYRFLRAVIDGTLDAVYVKDRDGKYLLVNEAAARFVGTSVAEALGKDDSELFDAQRARQMMDRDRRIMASGESETREQQLTTGGTTRTYLATDTAYRDETGAVIGLIGIARDITDRVRAEQAVRSSAERLQDAQRIARLGSWVWEPPTGQLWWSEALYELFGLDRSVAPSLETFMRLLAPDDHPTVLGRVEAVRAGADGFSEQWRIVRPDGRVVWLHSRGRATRDADGRLVRVDGIDQDITDRKRAEDELRASELRYRTLVDHATDAILLHDATGTVLDANRAACESLGYTRDEMIGMRARDFDRAAPAHLAQLLTVLESGDVIALDSVHRRKDGTTFPVEVRVRPFWLDGQRFGLAIVRDITDRKRVEDELRREQDRLATFAATAPGVLHSFRLRPDGTGSFPFATPAIREFYGLTAEELAADAGPARTLIHPADVGPFLAARSESARTQAPMVTEFRVRHPTRGEIWVQIRSAPVPEPDGGTIWHGFLLDVTDRKRAEGALKESEERFRATFEQAAVGIAHVAPDGRFLRVNGRFADITGYPPDELTARRFQDLTPPEDLTADRIRDQHLLAGTISNYSLEKCYLRRDGDTVWVNLTVALRRDAAGEPLHFISVIEDVSERRRAEHEVREARNVLQQVLDTVPHAVFWKDRASRHLGCNRILARALGFESPDQIVGRADAELPSVTPEQAATFARTDREVMDTGTARLNVAEQLTLADGRTVWLETSKVPLRDVDGRVIGVLGTWQDVTERRRMELALRESEERFRKIFENAATGIAIKDWGGRILQSNPAYRALLGYTADELPRLDFAALIHPDDRAANREQVQRLRSGELTAFEDEHRYVNRSGRPVWVHKFMSVLPDETGRPAYLLALVTDITERRRAEEALRESEARFRNLVATLPDAVYVNLNGLLAFCNPACVRLFGATDANQILGKTPFDLFHPDFHAVLRTRNEAMRATGTPVPGLEEQVIRFDGRIVPVHVTALPITDRGTNAILVVLRDLTEQKRVEMQVRQQEMMLREAAELAHVGGWGFDPVALKGDWTAETARIHDLDLAPEVTTAEGLSFFAGEDRVRIEAALQEAIEHGTPYDLELQLTSAAGATKWVRTICRPITDNGKVVRVRGSIQDITDRKRAEAEIRQLNAELEQRVRDRTAQLEAANEELEAFSYSVSHDLRAPLRAIAGFTRIVLDDYGAQLPDAARTCLADIAAGARQMGRLVDDLLEFSRLGRQPVRREPVNSNQMVADCLRDVLKSTPHTRIEPRLGDLPPCEADPSLLRQVWLNVLSNAVKYSAARDPAAIEVGARTDPAGTVYFVRDNGVGFDMRYAHKLFGVFQRLHRAEEYEGTGIGLALVQRIVHRHGGRIWAEAEPDKGATFFFTLQGRSV